MKSDPSRQLAVQKIRKGVKQATRNPLAFVSISRVDGGQVLTDSHCITAPLDSLDWTADDLLTVRRHVCEHLEKEIQKRGRPGGALPTPAAAAGVWPDEDERPPVEPAEAATDADSDSA